MADNKCEFDGEEVIPLGGNACVLHEADHTYQFGTMRPVPDGSPALPGEILCQRGEDGRVRPVYRMKVGPAQVATEQYRGGWDRVFGKQPVGEA